MDFREQRPSLKSFSVYKSGGPPNIDFRHSQSKKLPEKDSHELDDAIAIAAQLHRRQNETLAKKLNEKKAQSQPEPNTQTQPQSTMTLQQLAEQKKAIREAQREKDRQEAAKINKKSNEDIQKSLENAKKINEEKAKDFDSASSIDDILNTVIDDLF